MSNTPNTAAVFVTTYATGNREGFAVGQWFDLADFENKAAFIAAATDYARNVLKDKDPELCFSDYETSFFNDGLISELGISEEVWEMIDGSVSEEDAAVMAVYIKIYGRNKGDDITDTLNKAREAYVGHFDNVRDFVEDYLQTYYGEELATISPLIANNINLEHVYEDIRHDYSEDNGHYFHAL